VERVFRYAILSDTHFRPVGESSSPWRTNLLTNDRARWVMRKINDHGPELVIHLGDVVHPVPHLPTFGSACGVAKEVLVGLKARCYFVPGNHDVGDKDNPTVPAYIVNDRFLEKFGEIYGPLHQSFDHKGVHFVLIDSPVLNSGLEEERIQREWLEADLEESAGKRVHIFSHYPPYLYQPGEPNNYDNIDQPARTWLLDLMERHGVEAFFAGHVHHFGYRHYGDTRIYNLLSTCFVRQDFAEMFRVEAADEHGRNDAAKLGYCIVDVYEDGHVARIQRSFGRTQEPGEDIIQGPRLDTCRPERGIAPPLGVHLRHPLVEITDLPYNGPIDEFVRKRARNDYALLGLLETGIKRLRLPLVDIMDPETRARLKELHREGFRFGFFTVETPSPPEVEALSESRELVDFLEVILPWEKAQSHTPYLGRLRETLKLPMYIANIESSVQREGGGPRFSHYVSHGFHIKDTACINGIGRDVFDGFVFQVGQNESPWEAIREINEYAKRRGMRALVNVRLSSENPAEYLDDDCRVANRAAESLVAAAASPRLKVFLDTFVDLDRGYFPRVGLYDRRLNPRRGADVVRHLHNAMDTYGADVRMSSCEESGGWKVLEFRSSETIYRMLLPHDAGNLDSQVNLNLGSGGQLINLVPGTISELTDGNTLDLGEACSQYLVVTRYDLKR